MLVDGPQAPKPVPSTPPHRLTPPSPGHDEPAHSTSRPPRRIARLHLSLALLALVFLAVLLPASRSRSSRSTPHDELLRLPFLDGFALLSAPALMLLQPVRTLLGSSIPAPSASLGGQAHDDGEISFQLSTAHHRGVIDYPGKTATARFSAADHAMAIASISSVTAMNGAIPSQEVLATAAQPLRLKSVKRRVTRLRDPRSYLSRRQQHIDSLSSSCDVTPLSASAPSKATKESSFTLLNEDAIVQSGGWEYVEISAPNVSDRTTLLNLAKMAGAAYYAPNETSQWEPQEGWNLSSSFGWIEDGIRGHVFATPNNDTIVIALKGTSAAVLPGGGDTARRDKMNDNLLFSCCCAHVGWTWHTVCDCYDDSSSSQRCGTTCLSKALIKKSVYYPATTDLFNNISYAYPDSQIWVTGHSLGGALSSLMGMTFGVPVVTFEAPAERMAAKMLHVPMPSSRDFKHWMEEVPITHVYHSADPIPMGECVGPTSLCATGGFAMESRCHAGQTVWYDTVGLLGWSSNIVTHRIVELTNSLLDEDWDVKVARKKGGVAEAASGKWERELKMDMLPPVWKPSGWRWWGGGARPEPNDGDKGEEKLGPVPEISDERRCKDCEDWTFYDDRGKEKKGDSLD